MIAIWFTYPLQIFPVFEVSERILTSFVKPPLVLLALWRILLIAVTGLVAYFLPFFGLISGLIGALGSTALAFILPAIFHVKIFYREISVWIIIKDILIVIFGTVMMVTGTWLSIQAIIDALKQ
jgi:proton-coupled amino acid transporter